MNLEGTRMMEEINLLDQYPRSKRPIEARGKLKLSGKGRIKINTGQRSNQEMYVEQLLLERARRFDKEYFDGDRLYGYGGYHYHPRFWTKTVKRLRDHYNLPDNAAILDVGCAKGFMMYDFKKLMPNITIAGVDISQYACDHAMEEMKPFIKVANAKNLPYPDRSFDLVISISTIDHLPLEGCKQALQEIQRVSRKHAFITVHAWRTAAERELLLKWNITALTCMHVNDWQKLFTELGYKGDYFWFILKDK